MREQRRLAAILAADVVGYSRLMGRDESGTLARLRDHRKHRLEPILERYGGRLVKLMGDGALAEFPSAVDALSAAISFQQAMAEANRNQPADNAIVFRVGLHLGDLIVDGDDLYGDGVNVAARLEAEAQLGGILISGDVHNAVAGRLKATFADLGELSLKNIERPVRAYRVQVESQTTASVITSPAPFSSPLAVPDKPSIAVLPFQNMSGDPTQEYFADGIVEDIITELSRFKSLFVIARNSSFVYKGKAFDLKQVGRELGVRYALEGSVRKALERLRISAQLIECATGSHLWANKFDSSVDEIFDLQDQITVNVISAIAPKIDQLEIERARRARPENLVAYECMLQGMDLFYRSTKESVEEARLLHYRAIDLDPNFAAPYAMAARCYMNRKLEGWTVDEDWETAETRRLALQVQLIGRDDALALCWAGFALSYVCGEDHTAVTMIDEALSINPNLAVAWRNRGALSQTFGEHEASIEQVTRAIRLSPLDPQTYIADVLIAQSLICLGQYDYAVKWAKRALGHRTDSKLGRRALASATALAGNIGEAKEVMTELRHLEPWLTIDSYKSKAAAFRRLQDLEVMVRGLRLAGLPE